MAKAVTQRALLVLACVLSSTTLARVDTDNVYHRSETELTEQASKQALMCTKGLEALTLRSDDAASPLDKVSFQIHRNGDTDPCGSASVDLVRIQQALGRFEKCPDKMDKMDVESLMTSLFHKTLPSDACSSSDKDNAPPGLLDYCDMGEDKTPILLDHNDLVRVPEGSLPCRFYTREGVRVTSLSQLADIARDKKETCSQEDKDNCDDGETSNRVHLYAVPAGRVFMFAPKTVGEIFELPHVAVTSGLPVYLKVLSLNPRVFDIFNFFDKSESDDIVKKAIAETSPSHKIKRSTTGTGENSVFAQRTSENGFDTHGKTAQKVKKRCMTLLGFDEYIEGHTDGLQVLRYNKTTAYIPHMDYMTDKGGRELYDYESAFKGGNRYATILLYMSDMAEDAGGETVFSEAYSEDVPESERKDLATALKELRASGDAVDLRKGSWEEEMVAKCRTRLAIRPHSARAVLFYSQFPNGTEDPMSLHGGCPVLKGEKWAANLWTWSAIREGFDGAPHRPEIAKKLGRTTTTKPSQLKATFSNSGKDPKFKNAELYFDETGYWGKLGHGEGPLVSFTYEGHKWNIKVDGEFVKQFVIGKDADQKFYI
jgi:2OG-Fe(II) oxygenase superfamily